MEKYSEKTEILHENEKKEDEKVEKNLEKIKEKLVKYIDRIRFNNSCIMQVTGGDSHFTHVYETNFCTTCSGKDDYDYLYRCMKCRMVFFWDCAHLSHDCENINDDVVRIPFYKG